MFGGVLRNDISCWIYRSLWNAPEVYCPFDAWSGIQSDSNFVTLKMSLDNPHAVVFCAQIRWQFAHIFEMQGESDSEEIFDRCIIIG